MTTLPYLNVHVIGHAGKIQLVGVVACEILGSTNYITSRNRCSYL